MSNGLSTGMTEYAQIMRDGQKPSIASNTSNSRKAQLLALFDMLDERGQQTTLAMLAVAVKLHPKVVA